MMISRIHNKIGTAGLVVAIVALVAALAGTAFAAAGLNSTQKKEVKKIAKQYAGKDGAPGPQGPKGDTGAQGAKGDTGAKGEKGDTGAKGEKGEKGEKGDTGEAGACSATEPVCLLPSGATETGSFGIGASQHPGYAALSFNLALENPPTAVYYVNEEGKEQAPGETGTFGTPTHCLGSAQEPTAPSGVVCLYAEELEEFAVGFQLQALLTQKFATGVNAYFAGAGAILSGTWAVKAP